MSSWFTVKVKYTKQLEDGTFKRVTEPYLLAAMTFTDAEARIYKESGDLIRGEFLVTDISRTDIHDLYHYEDADVWYKCIITYEAGGDGGEEGAKAKKVSQTFLVTAHSVKDAYERLKESLGGMMIDYTIKSVVLSPIVDVFPFGDESEGKTPSPYDLVIVNYNGMPLDDLTGAEIALGVSPIPEKLHELALMVNCRERGSEIDETIEAFAVEHGLCVVFVDEDSADDGDCFFRGVIDLDFYSSEDMYLLSLGDHRDISGKNAAIFNETEDGDMVPNENKFVVNQNVPLGNTVWPFKVNSNVPHADFGIFEGDKPYCKGIIFQAKDLKQGAGDLLLE